MNKEKLLKEIENFEDWGLSKYLLKAKKKLLTHALEAEKPNFTQIMLVSAIIGGKGVSFERTLLQILNFRYGLSDLYNEVFE